jgi:hypothetical protein
MVREASTPPAVDVAFPSLRYDRVCRTSHSEAYLLSEGEDPVGRVDLHFGASVVHGLLVVERELPDEALHTLIERIDDELVWTADRPREDFLVTVYRGQEVGMYSDRAEEEELEHVDDEEAERGGR